MDRAARYDTGRYQGAVGLNWYRCDPTLQFLMRTYLGRDALAWAEPHLERVGQLMGGPVAERAAETDRNPPRLERYDRWGHEIGRVLLPASFLASRSELLANSFHSPAFQEEAKAAGADPAPLAAAWTYMLDQAEIGMMCALGTGGDMVVRMAERFAPSEVQARVRALFSKGDLSGEAAQMFTERTGGSDLGALETTAERDGDRFRLNGVKWFVSNVGATAYVALARIVGAPEGIKGVSAFLVLAERLDGRPNGIRVRRLKDKLGTRAVPSGEVELVDAEAWLLGPDPEATSSPSEGSGRGGLAALMQLTNGARLAIAMMGLGCARRSLVEAVCYARSREAFGAALIDQPLVQRKLAELVVEVEAAQALVFDGMVGRRLRLAAPLAKLRASRLGITAASDAIELHGGNGYIEDWPVARILRDAQVNPLWEGPDNILCLDVRRAVCREAAEEPFLERLSQAVSAAPEDAWGTCSLVGSSIADLEECLHRWKALEGPVAEARLYPLAQYMADVYSAALLLEQASLEGAGGRKALVARLFCRSHLAPRDRMAEIGGPAEELEQFSPLVDGAFTTA